MRKALLAIFALTLAGTNAVLAAERPALPPYAGAYQPQGTDERGIWTEADEDERALATSPLVVRDPALQTYVRRVLCATVGADRCAAARLYILRVPVANASMAPNGTLRLYTGMLLRLRSEAELAGILGHEFAHFEERHTLAGYRQQRTMSDIATWAAFLGPNASALQVAALGRTFSFSRAQEQAADIRSFGYLTASPYRPAAEAEFFDQMMDESDATAVARRQRSRRYDRSTFFDDHPTSLQRATYLHALAAKAGAAGNDGAERYRAALTPWRATFLADQVRLNDFGGTEYLLNTLAKDGWTGDLLFARGELYRARGLQRDLVGAAGFYREAIAKGYTDPEAHRGLGTALLRTHDTDAGCAELRRYLALRPDAPDAAMVAAMVAPPGPVAEASR